MAAVLRHESEADQLEVNMKTPQMNDLSRRRPKREATTGSSKHGWYLQGEGEALLQRRCALADHVRAHNERIAALSTLPFLRRAAERVLRDLRRAQRQDGLGADRLC